MISWVPKILYDLIEEAFTEWAEPEHRLLMWESTLRYLPVAPSSSIAPVMQLLMIFYEDTRDSDLEPFAEVITLPVTCLWTPFVANVFQEVLARVEGGGNCTCPPDEEDLDQEVMDLSDEIFDGLSELDALGEKIIGVEER